jgi:hypothetical protein
MTCKIVLVKNHGMTPLSTVGVILRRFTLTPSGKSSVQTGSGHLVGDPGTLPPTSALTAAMLATEPKHGLELRRLKALTPYIPRAWEHYIHPLNLLKDIHPYPMACGMTSQSASRPTPICYTI